MVSKQVAISDKTSNFSKENRQFIYSLVLIFLIPLALMANIFWGIINFQKDINAELEKKAVLAKSVLAGAINDSLANDASLQEKIDKIIESETELKEISILKPLEDGFQVTASSDTNNIGLTYKSLQYTTSWIEQKNINVLSANQPNLKERYRVIISPLFDNENQKVALVNLKISLSDIDTLSQKTLSQTLIILALTIFFVLLLLFNHFRFFQYAILFRRLKEVDKMKDDFISMASHELKTPMAAIKGYMGMIFEGVAGRIDQKAKDHLEKVLANIKRLDALINSLLDVSRIEQERIQFDMQAIDIAKTISDIVSELTVQADEKKIKIEYQKLPEPRPLIFADADRLAQIFDNVIGNAIKYTFKGSVTISHKIEGDKIKTMVSDSGIGMSKQDMKGLFTKFYRIRDEKTADIAGTGLGLWITKEIVLRMNGEIYAESEVDVGSVFTIVFPIMRENKK